MQKSNSFLISVVVVLVATSMDLVFAFTETDYHIMNTPATWREAAATCKRLNFGDLVTIESTDEYLDLIDLLESGGAAKGHTYWTDGVYSSSSWKWGTTGGKMSPGLGRRWLRSHPVNAASNKVLLSYPSRLVTFPETQKHRFICKNPRPTVAVPCYVTNDLLVVLDSSGSITPSEYVIAKDFSAGLALAYRDNDDSRVGFTIFSDQVKTIVHPVNTLTPSQSATAVQTAIHFQSGTATHLAIENGASLLASINRGVLKNLVVVTDGMSNNRASTIAAANAAIARGIRTYAVGIGNYDGAELVAIAGGDRSRVFTVPGFNQLLALLRPVSLKMCGP